MLCKKHADYIYKMILVKNFIKVNRGKVKAGKTKKLWLLAYYPAHRITFAEGKRKNKNVQSAQIHARVFV